MNLFLDSFYSHCKIKIELIKKMMRKIICNLLVSFVPTETSHIHHKKSKGMKEIFDFFFVLTKKRKINNVVDETSNIMPLEFSFG